VLDFASKYFASKFGFFSKVKSLTPKAINFTPSMLLQSKENIITKESTITLFVCYRGSRESLLPYSTGNSVEENLGDRAKSKTLSSQT
jgi:hypothetical protein